MSLIGTLTAGVSALRSFGKSLEVIGNNIANVNTTGYKTASTSFADTFSNTVRGSTTSQSATSSRASVQVGTGVRVAGIESSFTQGALTTTGNATDVGISGNGFFLVSDGANNTYATRDGQFHIDGSGYLSTSDGLRVQGLTGGSSTSDINSAGTIGAIRIGQNVPTGTELESFSIDAGGNIIEFYADGTSATTNRLLLQNFNDPSSLTKQGGNLYGSLAAAGPTSGNLFTVSGTATSNNPGTNGLGTMQSGTLELSNVDLTQEFSELITAQRSFQAGSRVITVSDSVLEDIVNLKR